MLTPSCSSACASCFSGGRGYAGRNTCAIDEGLELRPDDAFVDLVVAGKARKAAVGTGDYALLPEYIDPALQTLRDDLRMLHHHVRLRDHAGDHHDIVGQPCIAPRS